MSAAERLRLHKTDVTKVFVMSKTQLCRPVYMHAPNEVRLPKQKDDELIRSVYGMSECLMY